MIAPARPRPRAGAIGRLLCALGFHAWRHTSLTVITRPNLKAKIERCARPDCRRLR